MKTIIAFAMSAAALVATPAIAQQGSPGGAPPQGQGAGQPPQDHQGHPREGRLAGPPPLPGEQGRRAGQSPRMEPACPEADRDESGRCVPRPR